MTRLTVLPALDAGSYRRHALHSEERQWVEKNCYIDLWIEVIHALGMEPLAVMPFTAAIDFEGDQWTFYKPPHDELRDLYGIDVQELNVWRPLIEHAVEHMAAGKLISTEADAYWLPDTSGTDYRRNHVKTTIVLADLDLENRRLGYFHNAGYYTLSGEDFAGTFRTEAAPDPQFMPLFAEVVRLERSVRRPLPELVGMSLALWSRHLKRVPAANPVQAFRRRFESDLAALQERGLAYYHAWAFASTRQLGSAFELAAQNLQWLAANGIAGTERSIEAFGSLSGHCKSFVLKGARSVNSRRPLDSGPMFDAMCADWQAGFDGLPPAIRS
jgi:hypothetical protein